jgi:hypothetical protein
MLKCRREIAGYAGFVEPGRMFALDYPRKAFGKLFYIGNLALAQDVAAPVPRSADLTNVVESKRPQCVNAELLEPLR